MKVGIYMLDSNIPSGIGILLGRSTAGTYVFEFINSLEISFGDEK